MFAGDPTKRPTYCLKACQIVGRLVGRLLGKLYFVLSVLRIKECFMSNNLPIAPTTASVQSSTPKTKAEFNQRTNGLVVYSVLRVGAVTTCSDLASQLQSLLQNPVSATTTDTITVS